MEIGRGTGSNDRGRAKGQESRMRGGKMQHLVGKQGRKREGGKEDE